MPAQYATRTVLERFGTRNEGEMMTTDHPVLRLHLAPRHAATAQSTRSVFPNDTNYPGTMFGGHVRMRVDQTGAMGATRFAQAPVASAVMEAVSCTRPLRLGMVIETTARVVYTGRARMIARIEVFAENQYTGARFRATAGYLTMVALNDAGRPVPVPPLIIETEEEHAAHAAVQIRRAVLARVDNGQPMVGNEFAVTGVRRD